MKKIFAGIVLPTLAALAVIGSGFSVYFFGENQDKVSSTGSIKVENLVRIGNLTTSVTKADLHLDQTKAVREKILSSSSLVNSETDKNHDTASNYDGTNGYGKDAVANGIYLTDNNTTTASSFEIKYNKNTGTQYVDYLNGACKLQIVTTFTFSNGAENYVGMDTTKGTGTSNDKGTWATGTTAGVYTYTWTISAEANKDYSRTLQYLSGTTLSSDADFQFVYVAYANQYKDVEKNDEKRSSYTDADAEMKTAEPHTDAEYSAMLSAVTNSDSSKNGKLTIETVATIVAA